MLFILGIVTDTSVAGTLDWSKQLLILNASETQTSNHLTANKDYTIIGASDTSYASGLSALKEQFIESIVENNSAYQFSVSKILSIFSPLEIDEAQTLVYRVHAEVFSFSMNIKQLELLSAQIKQAHVVDMGI